jgi:hypothetical protein
MTRQDGDDVLVGSYEAFPHRGPNAGNRRRAGGLATDARALDAVLRLEDDLVRRIARTPRSYEAGAPIRMAVAIVSARAE